MKRILIANRGEIARRVIRSAHAMGIETVAVYSEPDAGALHVREAGSSQALGGQSSAESYLDIGKLIAAAQASRADAVHPGYGFLSENADFAQAVEDAGLVWIGPPPAAIRMLGSKAGAKALARQSGLPCLPGYDGERQDDRFLAEEADRVGYPLMIKAVAGGGGRGMRLVPGPAAFGEALQSARSEALAGFGSERVLIERALPDARHVEVQVFADRHGHCIHLGERDCSVQRRHQKIIEEAPSPAVDAELRERIGASAVALARSAGYVGAGTVEFLLEGREFFLLEMNTRLQVEHPVTEALTGQDLVAWQIRVARGEPLPWTQQELRLEGHAIEVRLCAEDENFLPHSGRIECFSAPPTAAFEPAPAEPRAPEAPRLRFDHAIEAGCEVSPFYDAMLGKLIVHAPDRSTAIDALLRALEQTRLLGLPTNRAFLSACLAHPAFRAGTARVPFLKQSADELRQQLAAREETALVAAATTLAGGASAASALLPCPYVRPLRLLHRGRSQDFFVRFDRDAVTEITSGGATHRLRPRALHAIQAQPGRWHLQSDDGVELWIDDLSLRPAASASQARAQTELRAPFNGRVIRLPAAVGDRLVASETAVVIESMKLEHSLVSTVTVQVAELLVEVGQQVGPGQLLLRLEPVH